MENDEIREFMRKAFEENCRAKAEHDEIVAHYERVIARAAIEAQIVCHLAFIKGISDAVDRRQWVTVAM